MSTYRWDKYFMDMCSAVSSNSVCLSRQLGAVLVKDKSVVSMGYNGPPRGHPHCNDLSVLEYHQLPSDSVGCPRQLLGYTSGKGLDICPAGHAERNALVNAARLGIRTLGTTLYLNGCIPCKDCLIEIINAGVFELVVLERKKYYDGFSKFILSKSSLLVREPRRDMFGG